MGRIELLGVPMVGQIAIKIAVTVVLGVVAVMCGRGMWTIWFAKKLTYRTFSYTKDGAQDATAGQQFTELVDFEVRQLHRLLSPPSNVSDRVLELPSVNQTGGRLATFQLPSLESALLPEIDIQAYGIQVTALVNRLYHQVAPPDMVGGAVIEQNGKFSGYAEIKRTSNGSAEAEYVTQAFQKASKDDAAFGIGCHLYRHLSASDPILSKANDIEFEVWAQALKQYQLYKVCVAEVRDGDVGQKALAESERLLNGLVQNQSQFPPIYKVRALIAASKGQFDSAVSDLGRYKQLLKGIADENADKLLASYQKKLPTQVAAQAAPASKLKTRPIRPGIGIGVKSADAASSGVSTICCIVKEAGAESKDRYILISYNSDDDSHPNVLQPSLFEGGQSPEDVIGQVTKTIYPQPGVPCDAAGGIAKLVVDSDPDPEKTKFSGTGEVQLGEQVRTIGRNGENVGQVTEVNATIQIAANVGIHVFRGLFQVKGSNGPFSKPGDAGAPVMDEQNRLVGMVYAGNSIDDHHVTYVMPINALLKALNVELVPSVKPDDHSD